MWWWREVAWATVCWWLLRLLHARWPVTAPRRSCRTVSTPTAACLHSSASQQETDQVHLAPGLGITGETMKRSVFINWGFVTCGSYGEDKNWHKSLSAPCAGLMRPCCVMRSLISENCRPQQAELHSVQASPSGGSSSDNISGPARLRLVQWSNINTKLNLLIFVIDLDTS